MGLGKITLSHVPLYVQYLIARPAEIFFLGRKSWPSAAISRTQPNTFPPPPKMARKRTKKKTHVGAKNPEHSTAGRASASDPKSMVIRIGAGDVGSSISQLATDVRRVMEPGTASRLKERRANRLKDYVVMCGPLGVTHMLLFSRSESGNTNLRLAATPRGPTMHFRVDRYSLCKDVQRIQKHPRGGGGEFLTPPLVCPALPPPRRRPRP